MPRRSAFTLIELLVVVTIIIALLAILLPSMNRAMFAAQTSTCVSNHRQRGIALISYATDNLGWFEGSKWPREGGLNPWGLSPDTLPNLYVHGMTTPTWFCAANSPQTLWPSPDQWANVAADIVATEDPQIINDELEKFEQSNGGIVIAHLFYWVPTRASPSRNFFTPHNGTGSSRQTGKFSEWPTRVSDLGTGGHPVFSDLVYTHPNDGPLGERSGVRGGHPFGGRVESASAVWPDGSARLRFYDEFELVQDAQFGSWY